MRKEDRDSSSAIALSFPLSIYTLYALARRLRNSRARGSTITSLLLRKGNAEGTTLSLAPSNADKGPARSLARLWAESLFSPCNGMAITFQNSAIRKLFRVLIVFHVTLFSTFRLCRLHSASTRRSLRSALLGVPSRPFFFPPLTSLFSLAPTPRGFPHLFNAVFRISYVICSTHGAQRRS